VQPWYTDGPPLHSQTLCTREKIRQRKERRKGVLSKGTVMLKHTRMRRGVASPPSQRMDSKWLHLAGWLGTPAGWGG